MSEEFNKRLDSEMDVLVDSFNDIIAAAKIQNKDTITLAEEGFQIECRATTIVRSCQTLLTMIASMKQSLLLNDTQSINTLTQTHKERALRQIHQTYRTLQSINTVIGQSVLKLQEVYSATPYK
ncbi:hypothetical protein IWQ61_001011 [Dispira simplex]|nr:hypothetical protein IWQ61_001011 [Dispira simplex]